MKHALALVMLVGTLFTGSVAAERPEIVAHRGASYEAPENTLASVRLAWDFDADAAEVDVYLSKDGRVVLMHDEDLERTAGDARLVKEMTWAELRELDAGSWKGARWAGEPVPVLEAVLKTIPPGRRMFVEVKDDVSILPELTRLIGSSGKSVEQIAIISFDYDVCVGAKKLLPEHKVYFLSGFKKNEETGELRPTFDEVIEKATAGGLDGIDISRRGPITKENVAKAHAAGLEVHVYTVNEVAEAKALAEAGVNGITTDRPDLLMGELGGRKKGEGKGSEEGKKYGKE